MKNTFNTLDFIAGFVSIAMLAMLLFIVFGCASKHAPAKYPTQLTGPVRK